MKVKVGGRSDNPPPDSTTSVDVCSLPNRDREVGTAADGLSGRLVSFTGGLSGGRLGSRDGWTLRPDLVFRRLSGVEDWPLPRQRGSHRGA